jgi:hypothetical protein
MDDSELLEALKSDAGFGYLPRDILSRLDRLPLAEERKQAIRKAVAFNKQLRVTKAQYGLVRLSSVPATYLIQDIACDEMPTEFKVKQFALMVFPDPRSNPSLIAEIDCTQPRTLLANVEVRPARRRQGLGALAIHIISDLFDDVWWTAASEAGLKLSQWMVSRGDARGIVSPRDDIKTECFEFIRKGRDHRSGNASWTEPGDEATMMQAMMSLSQGQR